MGLRVWSEGVMVWSICRIVIIRIVLQSKVALNYRYGLWPGLLPDEI